MRARDGGYAPSRGRFIKLRVFAGGGQVPAAPNAHRYPVTISPASISTSESNLTACDSLPLALSDNG